MTLTIIKKAIDLAAYLKRQRDDNRSIGFVPTMGALHQGHIKLIKASIETCDLTVCSIFVNPTQFNEQTDLDAYPRTLEKDIKLLMANGCDVLFAPNDNEIYPDGPGFIPKPDLKWAEKVMEAKKRPGHYDGVMQVVYRLLDIVQPDYLFMGQKDYQQQFIIGSMIDQYNISTKLFVVPTQREDDGLALSSRNTRLSKEDRETAPVLYNVLNEIVNTLPCENISALVNQGIKTIEEKGLHPEYLVIARQSDLKPVNQVRLNEKVVICVAAWADDVRLIDNMIYPGEPSI